MEEKPLRGSVQAPPLESEGLMFFLAQIVNINFGLKERKTLSTSLLQKIQDAFIRKNF